MYFCDDHEHRRSYRQIVETSKDREIAHSQTRHVSDATVEQLQWIVGAKRVNEGVHAMYCDIYIAYRSSITL